MKEADEAAEGLKTWREGMTVRRMHPPESVGRLNYPVLVKSAEAK